MGSQRQEKPDIFSGQILHLFPAQGQAVVIPNP